jgi:hypothetical protein
MNRITVGIALVAGLALACCGCGGDPAPGSPEAFQANLEKSADAAEGGKNLKKMTKQEARSNKANPLDDTF